jgi:hypothetical protein
MSVLPAPRASLRAPNIIEPRELSLQTRVPGHASARRCSRLFDRRRSQARGHHQNRRRHGVEICLSAADIPNTTFARTSIRLMFESGGAEFGGDGDHVDALADLFGGDVS